LLLIAPVMTWAQASSGRSVSSDQVSFYKVPLACPAARNLGCGSAAKPVLLALEKRNTIQEAWLDHPGTTLAIVWKKSTMADARAADLASVTGGRNISLQELTGSERDKSLKGFLSRQQWYRGAQVDKLSEEEAMVITDRLIRRATVKAPTIAGKSESLKLAFSQVIRERLTGCDSKECRDDYRKKLVDIARKNLNDGEFNALMAAEKLGYRAVGDEQ
jgi:hypothetical protein